MATCRGISSHRLRGFGGLSMLLRPREFGLGRRFPAAFSVPTDSHNPRLMQRRFMVTKDDDGSQTGRPPHADDFARLDILGNTPVPSTSITSCLPNGFRLDSGTQVLDGSGVLLVGGEAFRWRPWGHRTTLLNGKGQWEVDNTAFGLLSLVWPRPDLLILGLGPEMRPISAKCKRYLTALGMRVEILDTRNAASQYNLLATERGVDDVAAALVPIGWKDGNSLPS